MFLLLPNNLFENLSTNYKYVLYEHPLFFSDKRRIDRFHIKKLMLHRASMRAFYDRFKNVYNITYIEYNEKLPIITDLYHPCDKLLEEEYNNCKFHNNPLFLHSIESLEQYRISTKNDKNHSNFKKWSLKKLDIKNIDKSYDIENRKRLNNTTNIPIIYYKKNKNFNKYIKEANKYAEKNFKYVSEYNSIFEYPISHDEAKDLFIDFCKNRLVHYGDYQDFVHNEQQVIYHSMISSSLNIGLITPLWILKTIKEYEGRVNMNQYEGFIRQIVGWREYERYLYQYYYDEMISSNYFNNNEILPSYWFNGLSVKKMTEIMPIDDIIRKVFNTAYMNHIERLMFILNYMTLSEIRYIDIYKWFMTVCIDSYDWVMVSNISTMSYYYPKAMRKPYLAGSNYILKMSNYKKGDWCKILDGLYYRFLLKKEEQLKKTIYIRNIGYAKMSYKNDNNK